MVVSMIQFRFELPPIESIKEKRRIVVSLKEKLANKFHLSVAEVDLQDSLRYAQLGAAVVSNSTSFGEIGHAEGPVFRGEELRRGAAGDRGILGDVLTPRRRARPSPDAAAQTGASVRFLADLQQVHERGDALAEVPQAVAQRVVVQTRSSRSS